MARSTLLLPCLGLVGLAACVDNGDEVVVILQNQVPGDGCVVPGAPGDEYRGSGVIEAGSLEGYVFTPVLQNFSADDGNEQQRIAFVQGATIDIDVVNDLFDDAAIADLRARGLTHFRVPYAASIEAGGTASLAFEIVPQDLLEVIEAELPPDDPTERALLIVSVRVDGEIGSGDFETEAFEYPVEVCRGCLTNVVGECSALATTYQPINPGGACNPVQDAPVDCCTSGETLVCPAVGTMPPAVR